MTNFMNYLIASNNVRTSVARFFFEILEQSSLSNRFYGEINFGGA